MKRLVDQFNFKDKTVLVRTDYNVPLKDGQIQSDVRIRASLGVIRALMLAGAHKIILTSHLGRPAGTGVEAELSLAPVAQRLGQLLDQSVALVADWAELSPEQLPAERVVLFENLRFWPGEAANDPQFAQALVESTGAEVFVQDGFAVAHRQSATTEAIAQFLPSYASDNFAREYLTVGGFLQTAKRPLVAIVGGAKISDKIDFLTKLAQEVDYLVIGGAMANVFLAAAGFEVGRSLVEAEQGAAVQAVYRAWTGAGKSLDRLILPSDVRVVTDLTDQTTIVKAIGQLSSEDIIGDLGPETVATISNLIRQAGAVIWNGNLGYSENPQLALATTAVVEALLKEQPSAVIGGGDTVGFVDNFTTKLTAKRRPAIYPELFLSTGGGASLELLAYGELPGAKGLLNLQKPL